ncbi:MFS general substrate transporter [Periconia macrospinosa]|uniref:MFS general substrate transporter n=1 Tax=Periconia macrospinosa TaxID=97972 RepID=A0A2V1DTJ4_9PLEO|nr:MFS general substrate transporter [Periconia macrospinosa]
MDTEKATSSHEVSQNLTRVGSEALEPENFEAGNQTSSPYPEGIRFWLITSGMCIALFLTNLEIPIVTTSLVAITDDLGGFDKAGWLISSYLLGYVGVVVIFAKLSDIFGRKPLFATAISFFVIASAACGAAQTIVQLIVFRAFQGIGGGGCFALGVTMITDLVPPQKWAAFGTNIAIVYAISLLAGPIMGGAISERTTWRWVFLINIPCGVPALLLIVFAIPPGFPRHNVPNNAPQTFRSFLVKDAYKRLDFPGGILLLLATLTLTAGFHEADSAFPWKSAYVITLLTASIILWITLILWERHVTLADGDREPVMPWVFLKSRTVLGLLLGSTFLGGTWFVGVFTLPQKFQLVHNTTALSAGIRTMPFTFAAPLGAAWASSVTGRYKVPVIFVLFISAALQILGFSLLATLPDTMNVPARMYGFQIIAGFGCGITISLPAVVMPFIVDAKHRAVGMGAVGQVRIMGGAIVLSIATSVFHSYTKPRLGAHYHVSTSRFGHETNPEEVRSIYAQGYNRQMIVLAAFAGAQVLAASLLWKKKQVTI